MDYSGSMAGEKIQSLNNAVRDAIPAMRAVAANNPYARVLVRAVAFAEGAQWWISEPTPVEEFTWTDLTTDRGVTDLGQALRLVAEELDVTRMPERGLPPVLVLASDGEPTDDFGSGLKELLSKPWGKKAVRIAIGIGVGENGREPNPRAIETLTAFIANPEVKLLLANEAQNLTQYIRWASTEVLAAASAPASQGTTNSRTNVPLSAPPEPIDADDVW